MTLLDACFSVQIQLENTSEIDGSFRIEGPATSNDNLRIAPLSGDIKAREISLLQVKSYITGQKGYEFLPHTAISSSWLYTM